MILKVLCDPAPEDPDYAPLPEDRPGGFDWGNNDEAAAAENPEQGDDQDNDEDEGLRRRRNEWCGFNPLKRQW